MARIEGLPPATQQVLRLASVAGRRVEHDQLAAVSRPARRRAGRRRCAMPSPTTCSSRTGTDGASDAYAFRHALLREAIYTELLPGERSRLHARYADALAERRRRGAAAELAHHAMASHDLPLAPGRVGAGRPRGRTPCTRPPRCCCTSSGRWTLWHAVPDAEAGDRHGPAPAHHAGPRGWRAPPATRTGASRSAAHAGSRRAGGDRMKRSRPGAATPSTCWMSPSMEAAIGA